MERKVSLFWAFCQGVRGGQRGRRSRPKSGRNCTAPQEIRGRRRRIGSGRGFPTSGAFRTARLIAVLGKCPFGAGSRGPSSAAFFPPQPDFSRPKSGGLLIFAYCLLATLPKSTPPPGSQIRRGSSVSRGVLLSRGGVFQAGIVLGPLIFDSSRKGHLRDSGPSPFSACPGKSAPTFLPGRGIRPGFGPAQFRVVD